MSAFFIAEMRTTDDFTNTGGRLSVKSDYACKNEYQQTASQYKSSQNGTVIYNTTPLDFNSINEGSCNLANINEKRGHGDKKKPKFLDNEYLQISVDCHESLLARIASLINRGEMRVKTDNVLAVTGDYTYKENTKREAWLRRNLYVDYVQTMEEALNMLLDKDYVLIVVRADTVDNLQLLRVMHDLKPIPILVYSYTEPSGNVEPLKMGAHVYIASPCSLDFIIESGYALSQLYPRTDGGYSTNQPEFLTHEYIRVCVESRQVFVKGKLVDLKKKEFDVLCLLMQNKGKVLKYAEIFRQAWGDEYVDNTVNNLGTVIYRIKRKLKKVEPATKDYIKNIHQIGYSFDPR